MGNGGPVFETGPCLFLATPRPSSRYLLRFASGVVPMFVIVYLVAAAGLFFGMGHEHDVPAPADPPPAVC